MITESLIALMTVGLAGAVALTLCVWARGRGRGSLAYRTTPEEVRSPGTEALAHEMQRLVKAARGSVGVAAIHLASDRRVAIDSDQPLPMASVFKVPLAVTLLCKADAGELDLHQMIEVVTSDLVAGSGLLQMVFKQPRVTLSVLSLIDLMLVASDNSASDILLRVAGGPHSVSEQMRRLGIRDVRIDRTTAELIADFDADNAGVVRDRRDTATPEALAALLAQVWRGQLLRPNTAAILMDAMRRCATGQERLPALLPRGTDIAHKTGTLGAIANDIGVITLPDGSHVAIAVLSASPKATETERNRTIAELARATYDYFLFVH